MSYTGADLIADALAQLGVEHVFGIVSIHNMPLMDAINRLGKTKIINVRHEQAGTHAADGYARATGKMGVMLASTAAWFASHRIREACNATGSQLSGVVEMDATYIGGLEKNRHASKKLKLGGGTVGKQPVPGMRERDGRVKAMVVPSEDQSTIKNALQAHVEPGTHVYTDDHRGYARVGHADYTHEAVKHSAKEFVNGMAHTNGIESVWAVLKRGYNGTFHHFSTKHLHRYVDEFTFRLNEGKCEIDTIDRMKSVVGNASGKTLRYKDLIEKNGLASGARS